jgi:ABC-type polysaccharide/polyol phosphate export permease
MLLSEALKAELRTVHFISGVSLYKKYCGSLIGMGWSLLNPLIQLIVYYFAFGLIIKVPIDNYFVYLAAGLLPWSFLSQSLINSATSITSRKGTCQNTAMPHWIFVLSDISCELFATLIAMSLLLAVAIVTSDHALLIVALIVPVLLPIVIFTYGAGLVVAYLGVLYRDLPHLLNLFFSVMFWLTPIIYHWTMVPKSIEVFVKYNPLAMLMGSVQVLLHGGAAPTTDLLIATYVIAGTAAVAGITMARRIGNGMIYAL